MAGRAIVFGITLALLCTGCWSNLIVERRGALMPDKFTLTLDSCHKESSCNIYGAENEADCQCRCPELNSTFSTSRMFCIKNVPECADYTIGNDEGRLFTFNIINEELHPSLPVRDLTSMETDMKSCNTQSLTTEFEEDNGWFRLPSSVFTLQMKASSNATYLQIERGNYSFVNGRLVKVSYRCTSLEQEEKEICIVFKMQGFREVPLSGTESSTVSEPQKDKVDVSIVFWVTGGCIGALLMGALVSLSIICLWKKRSYKEGIKVDRLQKSKYSKKNIANKVMRVPNLEGTRYLSPQQTRRPIYKKNEQTVGSPQRAVNPLHRAPLHQSQNSAVFVVNEGEQRTLHPLPTERNGSVKKKAILKRSAKEEQDRAHSLRIARSALVQFEGERLRVEGSSGHRDELFNTGSQRMSRINDSLRGMGKRFVSSDPNMNNPNQKNNKKGKKEESKELLGSVWSIDYEHFEVPVSATAGPEESQLSQTPRSIGHISEVSIEDNERTLSLRGCHIDTSALSMVDEHTRDLPFTNIDELNDLSEQDVERISEPEERVNCSDSDFSTDSDTSSSPPIIKFNSTEVLVEEPAQDSDMEDFKYGELAEAFPSDHKKYSVESDDYAVIKHDRDSNKSDSLAHGPDFNIPITNIDDYEEPPELPPHPLTVSPWSQGVREEIHQTSHCYGGESVQTEMLESSWYADTPL